MSCSLDEVEIWARGCEIDSHERKRALHLQIDSDETWATTRGSETAGTSL